MMAYSPQYDVGPETRTILITQRFGPDDQWAFVEEVSDIQDFDPSSWTTKDLAVALAALELDGVYYESWDIHPQEICYQLITIPPTPYWH